MDKETLKAIEIANNAATFIHGELSENNIEDWNNSMSDVLGYIDFLRYSYTGKTLK